MTSRIEEVILSNLLADQEYCRKVLPFIQEDYFSDRAEQILFGSIQTFFDKHNSAPNKQILKVGVDDRDDIKQSEYDHIIELIDGLGEREPNQSWLLERTEKFCKDQAVYNSIMQSIAIMDGKNTKFTRDAIPSLLQEALAVSFDKTIGHDFFDDAERRYDFYHLKEDRFPFDLAMFNKITKGGLPKKTLSGILAGTGVGKSLFMCHHAASLLAAGKNVLYITLEMAEERIAERIDCNLMDIPIDQISHVNRSEFMVRMDDIKRKTHGKLVIKEYPTSAAHVGHFKALLDELKLKKNFKPDVVFVDYINICASQRYKGVSNTNSYFTVKAIAEELRGMAVEYDVAVVTATQTTRSGYSNTDVEMGDTSESFGLPMTLDFMVAIVRTEELDAAGQLMVKQLKSRFGDINYYKKFVIGVDIKKFKLYDVDQPTKDLSDVGKTDEDKPAFDNSRFAAAMKPKGDKPKPDLGGLDFDFD